MSIDTLARGAARAAKTTGAAPALAPDYSAFLRHAAGARRRRGALIVSLVLATLVAIVVPLSTARRDYRGRITPAERGRQGGVETPAPTPKDLGIKGLPKGRSAEAKRAEAAAAAAARRNEPSARTGADNRAPAERGRIFYTSSEGGVAESIWVMDADGTDRRRLAEGWKPDPSSSGQIAFVRNSDECTTATSTCDREIWIMNDDGSDQRLVTRGDSPDWSPDGKHIAFTRSRYDGNNEHGDGDVYIMNADGSQVRLLYRGTQADFRPRWSPDGRRIALTSPPEGSLGCSTIYIAEVDGPSDRFLEAPGCYVGSPNWSPDGKKIAFFSSRGMNTFDIGIYVANADGSGIKRLSPIWQGDGPRAAVSPSWSTDSERITYTFDADGDQRLYGPAMTYCARIGDGGKWQNCRPPGPMPADVYVMDADGSHPTRLVQGYWPEFSR